VDGGTIEIQTSSLRLNEGQAKRHPDAKPGEFVRLEVRDNGCGMSHEIQAHVFEPFFTTHDVGKGNGLGLASVLGEVKQLSGWIEFSSQVNVGTEFSIFLPCAPKTAVEPLRQTSLTPLPSAPARRGTVLLVEPDDRARGVARYILNRQGYHVIEADSAHIAEMLWEGQSGKIDLLLTDINLGGISGRDFVARLRQTRPDLNVVLTASPPPEAGENEVPFDNVADVLPKPYSPDKLLEAVQRAWPNPSERTLVSQPQSLPPVNRRLKPAPERSL
jgi:CheY-like chemotaxis protein